ncbi:MAG: hypothetical protein FWC64_12215, partial [Treponema sp.]|nr:hypothetical protein [Treponema sp.]
FIDRNTARWLRRNAGVDVGDSVTIALEARLLNGPKGRRHKRLFSDAVTKRNAPTLIDMIQSGEVFFDDSRGRGNLIYLFPHAANRFTKITVNPQTQRGLRGSRITGPVVVNLQTIPSDGEATELGRIRRLQQIR